MATGEVVDVLGVATEVVDVDALERWNMIFVPNYDVSEFGGAATDSPFLFSEEINAKVCLWKGDLSLLSSQAITCTTNESFTERNKLLDKAYLRAGPKLKEECRTNLRVCRTGDAKIAEGFNLAARYVIFTVGPRYNVRYRTAAESALYSCYRNVLQLVSENNIASVGLCPVHSLRRGYPPAEGAHIALRTIRRFLEKHGEGIDTIVITVTDENEEIYLNTMPLYFPRSENEAIYSAQNLPGDIGNEEGEPVVADRQIRVSGKPELHGNLDGYDIDPDDDDDDVDYKDLLQTSVNIGATSFARMQSDHDKQRQKKLTARLDTGAVWAEQQLRYDRLLRRSRQEDFTNLIAKHFFYQCGVDRFGRQVIVCVGRNFNKLLIDFDRVILYFIHLMNNIANRTYIIVYFHTLSQPDNQPEWSWLRHLYSCLSDKYRKNLGGIYVIHPTLWSKFVGWYQTTFSFSDIKDKVRLLGGIEYLYHVIDPQEIVIPTFVLDYDLQVNGRGYSIPENQDMAAPDIL